MFPSMVVKVSTPESTCGVNFNIRGTLFFTTKIYIECANDCQECSCMLLHLFLLDCTLLPNKWHNTALHITLAFYYTFFRTPILHFPSTPYVGFLLWSLIHCYWTLMGVEAWLSHSSSPFLPVEARAALPVQLLPLYDGWWKWTEVRGVHARSPHIPSPRPDKCNSWFALGFAALEWYLLRLLHHWTSSRFTYKRNFMINMQ